MGLGACVLVMVEIFRTRQFESALSAYKTWVTRSVKMGFYPASVALAYSGSEWSMLVVGELYDTYSETLPF
jgi:hypothetical protein